MKKILAILILASFASNNIAELPALTRDASRPYANLSPALMFGDLGDNTYHHKYIGICMVRLEQELLLLDKLSDLDNADTVDAVKEALKHSPWGGMNSVTVGEHNQDYGVKVYWREIEQVAANIFAVKVSIEKQGTAISENYTLLFSTVRKDGLFPVSVAAQEEIAALREKIAAGNMVPARAQVDKEAIDRYIEHKKNIDSIIGRLMTINDPLHVLILDQPESAFDRIFEGDAHYERIKHLNTNGSEAREWVKDVYAGQRIVMLAIEPEDRPVINIDGRKIRVDSHSSAHTTYLFVSKALFDVIRVQNEGKKDEKDISVDIKIERLWGLCPSIIHEAGVLLEFPWQVKGDSIWNTADDFYAGDIDTGAFTQMFNDLKNKKAAGKLDMHSVSRDYAAGEKPVKKASLTPEEKLRQDLLRFVRLEALDVDLKYSEEREAKAKAWLDDKIQQDKGIRIDPGVSVTQNVRDSSYVNADMAFADNDDFKKVRRLLAPMLVDNDIDLKDDAYRESVFEHYPQALKEYLTAKARGDRGVMIKLMREASRAVRKLNSGEIAYVAGENGIGDMAALSVTVKSDSGHERQRIFVGEKLLDRFSGSPENMDILVLILLKAVWRSQMISDQKIADQRTRTIETSRIAQPAQQAQPETSKKAGPPQPGEVTIEPGSDKMKDILAGCFSGNRALLALNNLPLYDGLDHFWIQMDPSRGWMYKALSTARIVFKPFSEKETMMPGFVIIDAQGLRITAGDKDAIYVYLPRDEYAALKDIIENGGVKTQANRSLMLSLAPNLIFEGGKRAGLSSRRAKFISTNDALDFYKELSLLPDVDATGKSMQELVVNLAVEKYKNMVRRMMHVTGNYSWFSILNPRPVKRARGLRTTAFADQRTTAFMARTTTMFGATKPGRSPEDALKVIALSRAMNDQRAFEYNWFTVHDFRDAYMEVQRSFGYADLPVYRNDSQSARDLKALVKMGYLNMKREPRDGRSVIVFGLTYKGSLNCLQLSHANGKAVSFSRVEASLKALPDRYALHGFDHSVFAEGLSCKLPDGQKVNMDEDSSFIFSENVTFNHGLGVMLPRLTAAGIRIGVVASTKQQQAVIDELNKDKPRDEKILYADTLAGVRSQLDTARCYYIRLKGDPETCGASVKELTFDVVDQIISLLGEATRLPDKLIPELYKAARKFAEAA